MLRASGCAGTVAANKCQPFGNGHELATARNPRGAEPAFE